MEFSSAEPIEVDGHNFTLHKIKIKEDELINGIQFRKGWLYQVQSEKYWQRFYLTDQFHESVDPNVVSEKQNLINEVARVILKKQKIAH